jgi:hypothetical protein
VIENRAWAFLGFGNARRRVSENLAMLYKLGRALQLIGLLLLPIAMAGNMADERLTLGQMLMLSGAGIAIFLIGWLLQQATRPR